MKQARSSYKEWRALQQRNARALAPADGELPAVTFLVSIGNGQEVSALETLRSLLLPGVKNWRVLPVVSSIEQWEQILPQLHFEAVLPPVLIDDAVSAISELANCDFLCFCRAGDCFEDYLAPQFHLHLLRNPLADIYYFDCEVQQDAGRAPKPFFKPAAASPELMLSVNYLSRGFIRRSSLLQILKQTCVVEELLELEYLLMLDFVEKKTATCHIPLVLVSQAPEGDLQAGYDAMIEKRLEAKGFSNIICEDKGGCRRVNWSTGEPSVSVIILNRNHGTWLRALTDSIFTRTDYENYSLIIVDNMSSEPDALNFYDELEGNARVTIVPYNEPFNYSTAINIGVAHSKAEIIALLNNDMLITHGNWLRELVQWAAHPEIGVVGGKLLHRNRTIQHAGIILGMNAFVGHLYLNAPEHYFGLAGSVDWYRNLYALTGACQAMRRGLFHEAGGYNEEFKLAFGDIDFCLRVSKAGYRNLYNPHAQIIHFEGGSRGYETPVKDILFGYKELSAYLAEDDPYFSPALTYTPIPRCDTSAPGVNLRLKKIEARQRSVGFSP